MRYLWENVTHIEVELSSLCNAACPQCPRNIFGGKTIDDLPLATYSYSEFVKCFPEKVLQHLKSFYLCGTYGDPMTAPDILPICEYIRDCNPNIKLGIHTNGGIRKASLYKSLAKTVSFIVFGIDGLEDTNHIYRRYVNFDIVFRNASAFINAGGVAEWDFIVFRHNQHQVEQAREFSVNLGFSKFNVKKTSRFLNKSHVLVDSLDVFNKQGVKEYTLYPPTDIKYINNALNVFKNIDIQNYAMNTEISCYHLHNNNLYIDINGIVWPCGWLADRLYGVESLKTKDKKTLLYLMQQVTNKDMNCKHNNIPSIIHGPWFNILQDTWTNQYRMERCGLQCGKINHIGEVNIDVSYKK